MPSPSRIAVTCTFCHRVSDGPAQVVGRAARLACAACYAALLDLAICWVCGEVVYRGDECVSLGWCFWHRACYGCLLCGSRAVCQGVRVAELFRDGDDDTDGGGDGDQDCDKIVHGDGMTDGDGAAEVPADGRPGCSLGREITTPPLCAGCLVETEMDELDRGAVVHKALQRMDRRDGGLARRRWEAQHGADPGSSLASKGVADLRRANSV